jgi:ABC-2 type transport system permease protein
MSQATAIQDRKPSAGGINSTFLWIEIKRMLRNLPTDIATGSTS